MPSGSHPDGIRRFLRWRLRMVLAGSRRVLPVLLAAACAGQQGIDESEVSVQSTASIGYSEHNDVSAPLTLLPPAPRSIELIEHEVKRIPRPHGDQAAALAPDLVH